MKYQAGFKFVVKEDEHFSTPLRPLKNIVTKYITLDTNGNMCVLSGFPYDGASGPIKMVARVLELTNKWLWQKYLKKYMRGACFHDAACWLLRHEHLLPGQLIPVNEHLYNILIEDKMRKWRARGWVKTLNQFDFYADPENVKEIYEAP